MLPAIVNGMTLSKKWNSLTLLMALSTWTRRLWIFLLSWSSPLENCCLLLKNDGITTLQPRGVSRSCITKPLSAIIWSPRCSNGKRSDCLHVGGYPWPRISRTNPTEWTKKIDPCFCFSEYVIECHVCHIKIRDFIVQTGKICPDFRYCWTCFKGDKFM